MAVKAPKKVGTFVIAAKFTAAANNFRNAVTAFSEQDWTTLKKTLDPNVVLYKIKDGQVLAQTPENVVDYLQQNLAGASFSPSTAHFEPPALPAKVSGKAYWHDNDGSADDPHLPYEFHINPGNSLILTLWAKSE